MNPYLFAEQTIHDCVALGVQLRIGIHKGDVVSGIVGQTANQFDLFGHDVNIAARLEQTCEPCHVHVSIKYFAEIKQHITTNHVIKKTSMKNMGDMNTVMISTSRDSFDEVPLRIHDVFCTVE